MQVLAAVFYGVGGCGREVRAGYNCMMRMCVVDKCGWLGCADCCHNNGVLAPDCNGEEGT
jgi:hypothetical protein